MNNLSVPAHYAELQVLLLNKPVQVLVLKETFHSDNLGDYTPHKKDHAAFKEAEGVLPM